jgi:hypothetical protein
MDKRFRDKDKSFWEGVYRALEHLDEKHDGYYWDIELGEEALRQVEALRQAEAEERAIRQAEADGRK